MRFIKAAAKRQKTTALAVDEWARCLYDDGMEVRKGAHGVYQRQYHLVWVTKYRRRLLKPSVKAYLGKVLPKLLRSMLGVGIETIGLDDAHIDMVREIPPKYGILEGVGRLTGQTSKQMRKTFPWLGKVYWKENIVWSPGSVVSSVGLDENVIRNYVAYQGRQDSEQLRMEL